MSDSPCAPSAFLQPTARAILSRPPPARLLPCGVRLGPWRVDGAPIEDSGMARYPVIRVDTLEVGVLEVVDAAPLVCGAYTERLKELMASIARMQHPGAVVLHDVGTLVDGRPYLIREVLYGCTLSELIADGELSRGRARLLLGDICDVLVAAHSSGVTQCSIELDHVLVVDDDVQPIKLLDWGIYGAIAEEARRRGKVATSCPAAMHEHSFARDIYDLGVMIAQMIPDLPPPLEELVEEMTDSDESTRPSVGEVARRIAETSMDERPQRVTAPSACPPSLEILRVPGYLQSRVWRSALLVAACVLPLGYALTRVNDTTDELPRPERAMPAAMAPVAAAPPPRMEPVRATPSEPDRRVARVTSSDAPKPAVKPAAQARHRQSVRAQAARSSVPRVAETVTHAPVDHALLQRYQRVGRALIMMHRDRGSSRTEQMTVSFRSIRIEDAMKSVAKRQETAALLDDIERAINTSGDDNEQ